MKLLRACLFACVMGLALSAVGCGGEPADDAVSTQAALTPSQVYVSPSRDNPGTFTQSSYQCAGSTWYVRQPVYQPVTTTVVSGVVVNSYQTQLTYQPGGGGIDYSRNEVQVVCNSLPWDTNYSTYMAAFGDNVCQVYAHPFGAAWALSANVTIPSGHLTYYPRGWLGHPNGAWGVYLVMPTSPSGWGTGYGLSGCSSGGVVTYYVY